tara:strand:+ start:172 stop:321 length:150 start_codon:yes stop_codon:yes gene_type:complete
MNIEKKIEMMMHIQEINGRKITKADMLEMNEDSFDDKFDNVDEKVVDEE